MSDASGKAANRFHFLGLVKLQFERSGLCYVFHKNLETIASFPFRMTRPEMRTTMDEPSFRKHSIVEVVKFFGRAEIIRSLEPLLRVGVEASQMLARQLGGAGVAKHVHERGIGVLQHAHGTATADTVWGVHD